VSGDTNLEIKGVEKEKQIIPDKPVLYLFGNHEYDKGSYPETLNKIIEASINSSVSVV